MSVQHALNLEPQIREWAKAFANKHHALFLGRGVHYPIALEGALKLKEISYIHAEAYAAGELKHGPIALIDQGTPVIAVLPNVTTPIAEKMLSNIQEVRARGAKIIAITDGSVSLTAEHVIRIPETHALLQPILAIVPMQVFAYEMAVARGNDVDQPRNLAKSVTVE